MLDLLRIVRCDPLGGGGYLAGEEPPDPNPNDYDGRARVMNSPAVLRIRVADGVTRRPVAQLWSAPDGTWRVDGLRTGHRFVVEYINDGAYTQLVGGEVLPVNSFVQDHVYAEPYGS